MESNTRISSGSQCSSCARPIRRVPGHHRLGLRSIRHKLKLEWLVLRLLTIHPIADASTFHVLGRGPEPRNRLLGCYYALSFYTRTQPILYSWISQNKAGHTKTTCTTSVSHCRSYQPKDFVEPTRQLIRLSITGDELQNRSGGGNSNERASRHYTYPTSTGSTLHSRQKGSCDRRVARGV
ncbi:hypothetical protein BDV93DRAFT_160990 [Ceratobasidium sp. AG-I]|nr:hypothetical protein BDV93DRAFT_160990 [Ceratobasidium sp. AG-I]